MSAVEPVVPTIEEWLQRKRVTMWGRGFDLLQNREAAARWFAEQVDDFLTFAESRKRG